MATGGEIGKLAMNLPERQRALLAAERLHSLPAILHDEDEGVAEALRRDRELEAGTAAIPLPLLDERVRRRRRR